MRKITHRELQIRKCGPWYGTNEAQDSSARHAKAPIGRKEPPALRERGSRQEVSAPCIRNRWPRTGSNQGQIPVGASRNRGGLQDGRLLVRDSPRAGVRDGEAAPPGWAAPPELQPENRLQRRGDPSLGRPQDRLQQPSPGCRPLDKRLLPLRNQSRDRLLPKLSQRLRAGGSSRVEAGDGERAAPLELGPESWLRRSGDQVLSPSRTARRGQLAGGTRDVAGNPGMRTWVLGSLNAGSEGSLPVGLVRRRGPGRQPIYDPRPSQQSPAAIVGGGNRGKKEKKTRIFTESDPVPRELHKIIHAVKEVLKVMTLPIKFKPKLMRVMVDQWFKRTARKLYKMPLGVDLALYPYRSRPADDQNIKRFPL
ncbi:hypothetical protein NDU88_007304 [Pleurodeles waltl]|uniref:Uncharacterized protein n=1 Tax=Pleurodeles waltl TaxID=8319 RepID=A0AAV7NXK6_PLEWA|nr:hypothetical protein NDU88_007304 [Pleurodeles waltl]